MERVKTEQLKEKGVGKYIAVRRQEDARTLENVSFVKIVDVVPEHHLLVLVTFGGDDDGKEFFAWYKVGDEVDIYAEDEAVLLAFRSFDETDLENKREWNSSHQIV